MSCAAAAAASEKNDSMARHGTRSAEVCAATVVSAFIVLEFHFVMNQFHCLAVGHLKVFILIRNSTVHRDHCFVNFDKSACYPILAASHFIYHL